MSFLPQDQFLESRVGVIFLIASPVPSAVSNTKVLFNKTILNS